MIPMSGAVLPSLWRSFDSSRTKLKAAHSKAENVDMVATLSKLMNERMDDLDWSGKLRTLYVRRQKMRKAELVL